MNNNNRTAYFILIASACIVVFGLVNLLVFLFQDTKMEGYVLDEKTRAPISNVLVDLKNKSYSVVYNDSKRNSQAHLFTDEKGYFTTTFDEKYYSFPDFKKTNYEIGGVNTTKTFKKISVKIYLRKIK